MTAPREEAIRKTVHTGLSLVAAAVVWWLPPLPAAAVLAAATFTALAVELLRITSARFGAGFERAVGWLLRGGEHRRLTGATTLALGYTLAALLFPGTAALVGIVIAGVADALAAVVGKRFGRVRYPGGKSLEGSAVFLVVVLLILWPLGGPAWAAILSAALLTAAEAPTLRVHDNLYLPSAAAAVVTLTYGLPALTFFS